MVKILGILLILVMGVVHAEGDINRGKQKSASCNACHGDRGISKNPFWPNLAGQKELYLIKQLKAFRDGSRKAPLMFPVVKDLTDADIEDLAAYYSRLK
jgi:cytochrome c553